MAPETGPDLIARPGARADAPAPATGAAGVVEKFRRLPRPAQIGVGIGVLVAVYLLFGGSGGGSSNARPQNGSVNMGVAGGGNISPTFTGIDTDRPALMQSVFEQNRRDMADMRGKLEQYFDEQSKQKSESDARGAEQQRQLQQMMSDFTAEIQNLQAERSRDSERLAQLAEQQKQLELNAPVDGSSGVSPVSTRRRQITQVSLGGGSSGGGRALLAPLTQGTGGNVVSGRGSGNSNLENQAMQAGSRLPFMPPLGFVKATILNGVDALVGGTPTPVLARLSGTYKTAMNTTVALDGCFALLEFSGNISTERAVGKPVRMTCVYPDSGAATYSLSGYVVDAEDGIIGVPGVLYEGDPTRIAASMLADFAAGVGQIIEQNQQTTTVDSNGTQQTALTGSQGKAQFAGGVNKAMSSLRDYLMERVNRVQPFIRLDATRDINLVILNGTELRAEGDAWTQLFDAGADAQVTTPAAQAQAAAEAGQPQPGPNQ